MINISIEDVCKYCDGEMYHVKDSTKQIRGVTIDSREVQQDMLFIPLLGERTDGHRYVQQSNDDGALISLWQRDQANKPEGVPLIIVEDTLVALQQIAKYYLQRINPKVIGVTGSNGKTTTKDMIYTALQSTYNVQKTEGNYNNEIGMPLTILSLNKDCEVAILEMGMDRFHDIELLSNLAKPDIAVITNIGESHMEHLGSREGIAKAKSEITIGLKDEGLLIIDGDEPLLSSHRQETRYNTLTVGLDETSQIFVDQIDIREGMIQFKSNLTDEGQWIKLSLLGEHNAKNALYSLVVAKHLNVDMTEAIHQLATVELTPMRMQPIQGLNGSLIINDAYNASPTSMMSAIRSVRDLKERAILVLGDMLEIGDEKTSYYNSMAQLINESPSIEAVYLYGEDIVILEQRIDCYCKHFEDKTSMTSVLQQEMNEQTVILFKGSRGLKLETIIDGILADN